MEYSNIRLDNRRFLCFAGLFFLGLVLLASSLAIAGIFYAWIVAVYITIGLVVSAHLIWKKRLFLKIEKLLLIIFLISVGLIIILSAYTFPTIFSGRDQGSYCEAAIRLSQNHKLEFSTSASQELFKIYGSGEALNFPGFNYISNGKLITHFPVGYTAYLAIFYSFFGVTGLVIANALAFLIFLISFYLLSRIYLSKASAFVSFFLVFTSFVFSWFFKFTLSENLTLPILFFSLYQFALYLKNSEKLYLFSSLLAIFTLLFVKIEGLAFLAVIAFVLYIRSKKDKKTRDFLKNKKTIIISIILAFTYFYNILVNFSYYKIFTKGFLHSFSGLSPATGKTTGLFSDFFYVLKILEAYGLLIYVILGIISAIYLVRKKKYEILVPFFIVLPSFIYLLQPSVSSDHPWMLRRFVFSIIPICILYSVIFLDKFFTKKYLFYVLSFLFLLLNLMIFVPYLTTAENKGLLAQIQDISQNFKDNDLVFIDQKATGSGWSMMAGPLNFIYNKQAVYFINPADVDKMDLSKFGHVYFIIPDDNLDMYRKSGLIRKLLPVKDYSIETTRLDVKIGKKSKLYSQPIELPIEQKIFVYGKIYLLK